MSDYKFLKVWEADKVAYISTNHPPLNVLDIATMEEINAALKDVKAREAGLKALVICAEGDKAFSAGVDVADHTEDKVEKMIEVFHDIFRNMDKLELPIIAAAKGMTLGGGCEYVLFCDVIVAADNLKIGQPEIKVGVFPPVAAVLLARFISEKKALELLLTGDVIRAEEAKALGLVNHVYPIAEFDQNFARFLKGFTSLSGSVLRQTKKAMKAASGFDFPAVLAKVEKQYLGEMMKLDDAKEGLTAFMEKRAPVWTDK